MNSCSLTSSFKRQLTVCCVGFSLLNCHGTEGDNPFAGPVNPSPCKGEADYTSYLAAQRVAGLNAASDQSMLSEFSSLSQALVARSEMPIGLQCLSWDHADGTLALTVSNFAGSCAVGWEGGTRLRNPGDLVIELDNPSCSVAGCGWCFYDSDAELSAEFDELLGKGQDQLDIELQLSDCNRKVTKSFQWQVPLRHQATGVTCEALGANWVEAYNNALNSKDFSEAQLNLYAHCETGEIGDVECTEDRTCVEGHCVPACTTDDDCPLAGALSCQNGACQLPK